MEDFISLLIARALVLPSVELVALSKLVLGAQGGPDIVLIKGDSVTAAAIAMHTRPDEFAEPAVFSPKRWESWTAKSWTYTPLYGGPRIRVGHNFAMTEMAHCLSRMAQRYERIEYHGDWAAQRLRVDVIGTPALDGPLALFEPA